MIEEQERKELLKLARDAISNSLNNEKIDIPSKLKNMFEKKQGVFVTLKKAGQLRGCIGFTETFFTLYDGIVEAARAAAFEDPRFEKLTKDELDNIEIEISVLSVPELLHVKSSSELLDIIEIGKHGLMIRNGNKSGLLLPQVPVEQNWDTKEFLEHLCEKAGLEKDMWMDKNSEIYSFEAEIFSE